MAFSDFRDTYSWKGAVELGPHLARLADELPAAEQMGLALQLRDGMVNLASGVGLDLLDGDTFARRRHAVRLLATLDLIDHVYPALDTAAARDALDKLLDRLTGPDFDERKGGKPRAAAQASHPQEAHAPAAHVAPHPAPETVPVIPDIAPPVPGAHPVPGAQPAPGPQPPATDDANPALKVAVHTESGDERGHQEA
jgi:hypothetical protein